MSDKSRQVRAVLWLYGDLNFVLRQIPADKMGVGCPTIRDDSFFWTDAIFRSVFMLTC